MVEWWLKGVKKKFKKNVHCYWQNKNQYILPEVLTQVPARPSWELPLFNSHVSQFQSGVVWKEKEEIVGDLHCCYFFVLKRLPGFLASVRVETARGAAAPDPQRRRRESEEMSGFCVRGGRDRRDTDINIQREREKEQPPLRPGSLVFF